MNKILDDHDILQQLENWAERGCCYQNSTLTFRDLYDKIQNLNKTRDMLRDKGHNPKSDPKSDGQTLLDRLYGQITLDNKYRAITAIYCNSRTYCQLVDTLKSAYSHYSALKIKCDCFQHDVYFVGHSILRDDHLPDGEFNIENAT